METRDIMRRYALLLLLLASLWASRAQAQSERLVLVLTATGPLTPAMIEYLDRGLLLAERRGAEGPGLPLDTPGGPIDHMNQMVQSIRASAVPVVVYIAPRGAIAASAGTVITLAGHAAAMAPETAIGAASPVGGLGEATIEDAKAASAQEALEAGLIDLIAEDLEELVAGLDGLPVELQAGVRTLHSRQASIEYVGQSFIEQLLGALTNPNIVFLLMAVGVQAVLIEIGSPGGWAAGLVGVACLSLGALGLGVLPVNWFGIIFIATAFVLFILDIKAPTHGALTAAGTACFIVGSLVLFNSPGTPAFFQVSVPLVVGTGVFIAGLFLVVVTLAIRAQRRRVTVGSEALIGLIGVARTELSPAGTVLVGGELWSAQMEDRSKALAKGDEVEVISVEGLRLRARPPR